MKHPLMSIIYNSVIGSIMSLSHSNNYAGAITVHFVRVSAIGGLQGWRGAGEERGGVRMWCGIHPIGTTGGSQLYGKLRFVFLSYEGGDRVDSIIP